MSKLGLLQIAGQVSPCNKTIQVENQLVGATVTVSVGSATVVDTATSSQQPFKLPVAVNPGDKVVVSQSLAGFTSSDATTITVGNLPTAADLSKGNFYTPFYECAQCIWLYGLSAEARVEVFTNNNQSLGGAPVRDDGQVHVDLRRSLIRDDNLTAVQTDCRGVKSQTPIKGGRPQALPVPLPQPTILQPVACDRSVTVQALTPGAQVSVTRGGQSLGEFCSALPELLIAPITPLRIPPADDSLSAQQAFPNKPCEVKSIESLRADVQAANPGPPTIKPPLCEGQPFVNVDDMRRDAIVELTVNGQTLVLSAPAKFKRFDTPPLEANTIVTVRQNLCGDPASWSVSSPLTNQVASVTPASPLPVYPANGANPVSVNTQLAWNARGSVCNFPDSFDVQMATDVTFTRALQQFNNVTAPGLTLTTALQYQTTYFWRVQAHKGTRSSGYSATSSFTTQQQHVTPPNGGPPPPQGPGDYCFNEYCNGFFERVIVVTANSPEQARSIAEGRAAPSCEIGEMVPCSKK